jgi:hypothetical protein
MSQAELEHLLRAAPPVAPERLRARVRELRVPAPRRAQGLVLRRLALPAVAAVAIALVGAAALRGVLGAGETHPNALAHKRPAVERAVGHAATSDSLQAAAPAATRKGFVPAVGGGARLTQVVASLRLRVADGGALSHATGEATRIARAFGGYAASVDYRTPQGRAAQAFLELRIPTRRVQAALARLGGLGTIVSQRLATRDLENQLERQTAQIAQLREQIRLTLAALRDPSLSAVDRIRLQLKLNEAKRALGQRLHARKGTIAAGTLSRVALVLTTQQRTAVAHTASRLHRMLASAASFLGLEATIALYALIVVSPLLPFAVAAWWLRRRRDERLLALP